MRDIMAASAPMASVPVKIHTFKSPAYVYATELEHTGMSSERSKLCELEHRLSKSVRKSDIPARFEVDEIVAVQAGSDDRLWHRGKIEYCFQLSSGNKYRVRMLDQGISLRLKPKFIRAMPFKCDDLPPQAMSLILDDIVPLKLVISPSYDEFQPEISKGWTPAAEKFVEEEILKKYDCAYFVEGPRPRMNQMRFGDLLICMGNEKTPKSLTQILCDQGHGKVSQTDFEKWLRKLFATDGDTPELCRTPLTPLTLNSSGRSSSCGTSPAETMPGDRTPISDQRRTMADYKKEQDMKRLQAQITEESVQAVPEQSKLPPKVNRSALFAKLKRTPDNIERTPCEKSSLNQCNGRFEIPLEVPPKDLGPNFLPAGRSIVSEPKPSIVKGAYQSKKNAGNYNSDSSLSDGMSRKSPISDFQTTENARHLNTINGLQSAEKPNPLLLMKKISQSSQSSSNLHTSPTQPECSNSRVANEDTTTEVPLAQLSHPSSMRDRLLRYTDDDTRQEEYLARSVLLHGGFRPDPWMTVNHLKSKFTTHIEQILMDRRWCYNLMTLEKFMWPAIQQRQNVVMISPKSSGKTTCFVVPLMDFMIDLEGTSKGNGPIVLILCAGSKTVSDVHAECVKLVNGVKNAPRVYSASGLAMDKQFFVKLLNGCEVFITTPPCFLRILEEHKNTYALNLRRLEHLVLDQAGSLMSKFLPQVQMIQSLVGAEQERRSKSMDEEGPIQIIVSSETWDSRLLSFSTYMRRNPLLCINDCFEACVYGKLEVSLHGILSDRKQNKLLGILREISGHKIVVFCDKSEVLQLKDRLKGFVDLLVLEPDATNIKIEEIKSSWDATRDGEHYVLLCSDGEFEDMKCRDATYVIHYSLPLDDKTQFVKRLSAISYNIPNMFDNKPKINVPSIILLMDENNEEQCPVITQLMKRISCKIDDKLLKASKVEVKKKEKKTKQNSMLCKNVKMFGACDRNDCPSRHVYLPEVDDSYDLPRSGVCTMLITQVHSAAHLSARLIKRGANTLEEEDPQYMELMFKMSSYFSREKTLAGEIVVGQIFAMESVAGLFKRVEILEVKEKNKFGNPTHLLVRCIDDGSISTVRVFMLYSLPEDLKGIPAQAVDVFLCGLLPADLDDDYCPDATRYVQHWVKSTQAGGEKKFQGKIVMSMTRTLWVDRLNVIEWLPITKEYVIRENIRKSLLEKRHALENPHHLSKLLELCGREADVGAAPVKPNVVKLKEQPKPDWAFFECDVFEEIEFSFANEDSTVYFRKTKFTSLLNELMQDINKEPERKKSEEVSLLSEGDLCLAVFKEDKKWYRAKILSKNEDGLVKVFYVDFGDVDDVTHDELNIIPDWAIRKLPCQVIQCSLAGVSACPTDDLYEALDGKDLFAKVCERTSGTGITGGHHYVVAVVDNTNRQPFILNKELLKVQGVEPCAGQLDYLEIEIDEKLFNRVSDSDDMSYDFPEKYNMTDDFQDELSELEFEEDGEDGSDWDRFEVNGGETLLESILKENPGLQTLKDKQMIADVYQTASKNDDSIPMRGKSVDLKSDQGSVQCAREDDVPQSESFIKDEEKRKGEMEEADWDEEVVRCGRDILPLLCPARIPRTKWFEDLYYVWLKFCVTGVDNYFLRWTCTSIQFSTFAENRIYHLDQALRGSISPGSLQHSLKGFTVEVKMKKACSGVMWDRPFFDGLRRVSWLSRDLEVLGDDSSDSDCDFSLKHINQEIRNIPYKQRRRRVPKDSKGVAINKPALSSDDEGSECVIDSDEMF